MIRSLLTSWPDNYYKNLVDDKLVKQSKRPKEVVTNPKHHLLFSQLPQATDSGEAVVVISVVEGAEVDFAKDLGHR